METNNGSNKFLIKQYIYNENWLHRVKSLQVKLLLLYYEGALLSFITSNSNNNLDKVDIII